MARRSLSVLIVGALLLALVTTPALGKRPPPKPQTSIVLTLSCDWEPVPDDGWPPIPAPHLDAFVAWEDAPTRAELSIGAGDVIDGVRRDWGGHWELLRREPAGSRDLHLDVWIGPSDRLWTTAQLVTPKGIAAVADAEIDC